MKDWILGVIKFILAVLLAPALVAVTRIFYRELQSLQALEQTFILGTIVYVLIHLFLFVPQAVYQFGQRIFTQIFKFSPWLTVSVPLIIPIFTTLLLVCYYITTTLFKIQGVEDYVIFSVGLTLAMHLILSAKELYETDDALLKPHYFLCLGATYLFSLFVVSFLLSLNFPQFSFASFAKMSWIEARHTYQYLYNQLFL